jgi:thiaminase/transcriptional activator TenA
MVQSLRRFAMDSFRKSILESSSDLIDGLLSHPFVVETANGTISDERFRRWLVQDYLWIKEFERFLAVLGARAPQEIRRPLFEALMNLHGEIEIFEEMAARIDVDLLQARMTLACNAYASFLQATVSMKTFAEALSACYGSEYSYLAAWSHVKREMNGPSPWQEFIDLWSSEAYAAWVDSLGKMIDAIPVSSPPILLDRMKETFRLAIQYETHFWNMAYQGSEC